MVEDKYIGLLLAVLSTLAIGTSFVITKQGLNDAKRKQGFDGEGFAYIRNPIWWTGMITMGVGEVANFAAYAFAPAILVTPLGALSVLIGAILGAYFLKEDLGRIGKIGCALCLLGSVMIVVHAPPDKQIERIDELMRLAMQPLFLLYCLIIGVFSIFMIYQVAPKLGLANPLVYISICSTVGSISIMATKALGIAVKLTFGGHNQFTSPSTYFFIIVIIVCIATQMNYFNKALAAFPSSLVNPLYYVTFTTCTLVASFILFQGFNTTNAITTVSLLSGFLLTFSGVYLLNVSRTEADDSSDAEGAPVQEAAPTDPLSTIATRRSMQGPRQYRPGSRSSSHLPLNQIGPGRLSSHNYRSQFSPDEEMGPDGNDDSAVVNQPLLGRSQH